MLPKLYKQIIVYLSTVILFILPFTVFSEELETQISADTITVERGEVLYAVGNVLVQHGNNKIKANALEFNQKSNKIKFIELQNFYDGKGLKYIDQMPKFSRDFISIMYEKLCIFIGFRDNSDGIKRSG